MKIDRLKKRLYRLRSFRRKGFGIHSPYTFNLITSVIAKKKKYAVFEQLKHQQKLLWQLLKQEKEEVVLHKKNLKKQGWSSKKLKSSRFVCRLIFRLQKNYEAKNPLYISDNLFFPIAYMASANTAIIQHAVVEENSFNYWLVDFYNEACNLKNIRIKKELKAIKERSDFIVIDDVASDRLINDFETNYPEYITNECIIVIGNIYQNKYHRALWYKLKEDKFFRVCIDYYPVGILIAREGMQAQSYKL